MAALRGLSRTIAHMASIGPAWISQAGPSAQLTVSAAFQPSSLALLFSRGFHGGAAAAAGALLRCWAPSPPAGLRLAAGAAPVDLRAAAAAAGQCLGGSGQAGAAGARSYATANKLRPRFLGGKLKPYSAYKERFKMTGSGKIRYMKPGHVHKRFNKGRASDLGRSQVLHDTYAATMRRLGFKMRSF